MESLKNKNLPIWPKLHQNESFVLLVNKKIIKFPSNIKQFKANPIQTEVLWANPTFSAKFPSKVPNDESGPLLNLNPTVEQ